ncbi:MAG: exodeoxyribonuclease III [Nanoarchaeota archaeon]|nr:exodeoxyribonuclease III [Nanoarchaeota archaeon]
MKIISWNVNGIRATLKKGGFKSLEKESPDIIGVQEIKAQQGQVPQFLEQYPVKLWNSAVRPGYSGTALFMKEEPHEVMYGLGMDEHDQEGRVITADLDKFFLVNVYTPNSKRGLARLPYRLSWDHDFLQFVKQLEKKRPVLIVGDLNVAHQEIDLFHPDTNHKNPGFTDEERQSFSTLLDAGFVDMFRQFTKSAGHYTWWNPMAQCRVRNIGWRIDYTCASKSLQSKIKSSTILPHVFGSDHCPVSVSL